MSQKLTRVIDAIKADPHGEVAQNAVAWLKKHHGDSRPRLISKFSKLPDDLLSKLIVNHITFFNRIEKGTLTDETLEGFLNDH